MLKTKQRDRIDISGTLYFSHILDNLNIAKQKGELGLLVLDKMQ